MTAAPVIHRNENPLAPILERLQFSQPRELDTRAGRRIMRNAVIHQGVSSQFWALYKSNKAAFLERGYSVSKYGENWQCVQWLNTDSTVTRQSREAAKEERGADANSLPSDWIPEDVHLESAVAEKLLDYQRPAVLRLKRALMNGNALDASETGVGKTFCALAACAELDMTPCVIAPLAVLPSWQRAAAFMGVRLGWCVNYEKLRTGKSGLGRWRMDKTFQFDYLPGKRPLLIFDEIHKAKGGSETLNGKLLLNAASDKLKILGLSATAAKDPTDMHGLGSALGLHDGSAHGFKTFLAQHGCFFGGYGMKFDVKQRNLLDKLHRKIFPLKGNRLRIADIPDFPEVSIHAEALDTGETEAIKGAYDEMEATLAKLQADSTKTKSEKSIEGLAAIMSARRESEKGKLPLFTSLAKDAIEEGRSVIVFLNFRDHVFAAAEMLKTKCMVLGGQKPDERQKCIDDFQADKSRVMIISLQAGGAGLSLHDLNGNHPRLSLISPSYSAVDLKQSLGRAHRAGAKTKSAIQVVFASGTIEEEICRSIREKLVNIDRLNDAEMAPPSILRHVQLTGETVDALAGDA